MCLYGYGCYIAMAAMSKQDTRKTRSSSWPYHLLQFRTARKFISLHPCIHTHTHTHTHTQRQEHFKPLYKVTHSTYVLDNCQNQSLVKYQELTTGDEMCIASYSTIMHHFREQRDRNHLEKYTFFP